MTWESLTKQIIDYKKAGLSYSSLMFKRIALIFVLLVAVAVFEFHPAVEQGRTTIPEEIYVGKSCDCACILASRPWYSTFNYWFWLWVAGTPLIVFSVNPTAPRWQRMARTLLAIAFCYGLMNLALHLSWDIRNGPFMVNSEPDSPWQKTWDMQCANVGDGASLVFTAFFGWIPACLYTGVSLFLWHFYHSKSSKDMAKNHKNDILTCLSLWFVKLYCILFLLFIVSIAINAIYYFLLGDFLYDSKFLFLPYYLIIRPLFIPFEIFWY